MDVSYLILAFGIGLVVGIIGMSYMAALSLVSAHEGGKLVFIEEEELKKYLVIVGVEMKNLKTVVLYKDVKLSILNVYEGPLSFLKDLDLDDHR